MLKWQAGAGTGSKAKKKKCKHKKQGKKCKKKHKRAAEAKRKKCKSKKHRKGCKKKAQSSSGRLYLFAGSAGGSVEGKFSVPCVGDGTAAVVGENRSAPVRGGSFSDHFADGNAIHIYRIDTGSRCGLPASAP